MAILEVNRIHTKRTMIRLLRSYNSNFSMHDYKYMQEKWGVNFLQKRFPMYERIRLRWMSSHTFWKWARRNFDFQNMELLNKLGYGIHFTKKISFEEAEKFIYEFHQHHEGVFLEIFPPNPIAEIIDKESKLKY